MSAAETVEHKHTIIITHKPQPASIGNVCYGAVATGRRRRKVCVIGEDGTAVKEEVVRSGHMRNSRVVVVVMVLLISVTCLHM